MSGDIIVKVEGLDVIINRPKIGIGLSIGGNVSAEFLKMLLERFVEWLRTYSISILIDPVIPIDLSRNNIVNLAIQNKCEHIFFIDSDVLIEEGHLDRLLSHNKAVVSGVYYKRAPFYEPLPRRKVAENLYVPIEPEGNEIIEIDGTGMGCLLVNMDVFDKIPYPWFEFKYNNVHGKWSQLSEDLYFCQKLQNIGIKIYCDPTVQCSHIGTTVSPNLSYSYKNFRASASKERDMVIKEVSEFTGLSPEYVYSKWQTAPESVAKEYKEFMSQDHHSIKDFYKISKNYIFDLTVWHTVQKYGFDTDLPISIRNKYPNAKKILDFGSGCGQNAIILAEAGYDVCMADYEGYTSAFAKFRTKKRGLNIRFYDIEKIIDDRFDIILVFDVLEHVPDGEFEETIELLRGLKADGGVILTATSFGTQGGLHPMHYEESPEKLKLIEKLNE
jgi:ubiquinone/menaquinone biosynthesis C-methylase UbiE